MNTTVTPKSKLSPNEIKEAAALIRAGAAAPKRTAPVVLANGNGNGNGEVPTMTLPNGVIVKWLNVGPDLARQWLERNKGNRSLREDTVSAIARDITAGHWQPTHQGVAFDAAEVLIDGQHRLEAILLTGATVEMMVSFGWPPKTMDAVDGNVARSVADRLKLQHGVANAHLIARSAVVVAQLCFEGRIRKLTLAQALEILGSYEKSLSFAIEKMPAVKSLRQANVLGAMAFAHSVLPEKTAAFYQALATGEMLAADSPILQARNFLLSDAAKKLNMSDSGNRVAIAELVLHALHLWMNGRTVARLEHALEGTKHISGLQAVRVEKVAALFRLPTGVGATAAAPRSNAAEQPGANGDSHSSSLPHKEKPSLDAIIQKVEMLYGCAAFILLGKGEDDEVRYPRAAAITLMLAAGYSEVMVGAKFKRSIDYVRSVLPKFERTIAGAPKRAALLAKAGVSLGIVVEKKA